MIFHLVGGLGLFLVGINIMSENLKSLAGNKMKKIIEKSTNTPIKGVVCGAIVTILIQSSSATTALSVGLVQAGLMTLTQAAGVIIGANIGTTVTSILIGLNVGRYALIILGIGALIVSFTKKKKARYIGGVVLGFGMLFLGLNTMSDGMSSISSDPQVMSMFAALSNNPLLGVLIGTAVTALVQSSAATVGILQVLYAEGSITLSGALPILLGCNIGTTVTALFASIGVSKPAKRAAIIHVIFNFVSTIIFLILLWPYTWLIQQIENLCFGGASMMTISVAHIVFNLLSAFIMFWFIKWLVFLATKIIPGEAEDDVVKQLTNYNVSSPVLALEVVKTNITQMGDLVKDNFGNVVLYANEKNEKTYELIMEKESRIDLLDKLIHDYLINIASMELDQNDSVILAKYLDTIRDLERIGDHCTNIAEFYKERYDNEEVLSEMGTLALNDMYQKIITMLNKALNSYNTGSIKEAKEVMILEDEIDFLEEKYRKEHILRLYDGTCKVSIADNFADILSNLERIGDHCTNIAQKTIKGKHYFDEKEYVAHQAK